MTLRSIHLDLEEAHFVVENLDFRYGFKNVELALESVSLGLKSVHCDVEMACIAGQSGPVLSTLPVSSRDPRENSALLAFISVVVSVD